MCVSAYCIVTHLISTIEFFSNPRRYALIYKTQCWQLAGITDLRSVYSVTGSPTYYSTGLLVHLWTWIVAKVILICCPLWWKTWVYHGITETWTWHIWNVSVATATLWYFTPHLGKLVFFPTPLIDITNGMWGVLAEWSERLTCNPNMTGLSPGRGT